MWHYIQGGTPLIFFDFVSSPTGFDVGAAFVYSGATGDLSGLNGTYTINQFAAQYGFMVITTDLGIVDSDFLVPGTFNFGSVALSQE